MSTDIKIALVDDHILLRDALAAVVNGFDGCKVCLLASNGRELMEKLEVGEKPDLILLDLNMPEIDGYETAEWLQAYHPSINVLALTMYNSELAMIRFLRYGVKGILNKDIHPGELRKAIMTTMESGFYYTNQTTSKLINLLHLGENKTALVNNITLSDNEIRFLHLVSTEMTYKEIAQKMKMSPRTIDNYRDALFSKLGVKSRVGLVLYALRSGIFLNE